MAKIPKYIEKLLEKRYKAACELTKASMEIDEYCEKIGLDIYSPLYENACLCTDFRIWCEADGAANLTRNAILKQLELNEKK